MKRIFIIAGICLLFLFYGQGQKTLSQCTFDGKWDTNWGIMNLKTSGVNVTGNYTHDQGKVTATINGSTLKGTWSEYPSYAPDHDAGDMELTLNSDCNSFIGNWRYGSGSGWTGGWTGTKIASTSANGNSTLVPVTDISKTTGDLLLDTTDRYLGACSYTDTTTWTAAQNYPVTILQIWYNWSEGDTSMPFTMTENGKEIAKGSFAKTAECQWSWCNGNFALNKTLKSGSTYVVKLAKNKQCMDNKGRGAVRLYGNSAASTPVVDPYAAYTNSCESGSTILNFENRQVASGKSVQIPLSACNVKDIANMDVTVTYNPSVLTFSDATKGSLNSNALFESNETTAGTIKISFANESGFSGSGTLAILEFTVKGKSGNSTIAGTIGSIRDGQNKAMSGLKIGSGTFTVGASAIAGDCDGDNLVSSRDALAALKMSVGKLDTDLCYDLNSDGKVDSSDARAILKKVVE